MKKIFISLYLPLIWFACTQEGHLPVSTNRGKPAPVTDVKTVSVPGGAIVEEGRQFCLSPRIGAGSLSPDRRSANLGILQLLV